MKKLILLLGLIACCIPLMSQHQSWQRIVSAEQTSLKDLSPGVDAEKYTLFSVNKKTIESTLRAAVRKQENTILTVPLPNGQIANYEISIHSNFAPELQQKYPNIVSFKGKEAGKPQNIIRGSWSSLGFHAVLSTEEGEIYIDPFNRSTSTYHMSYFTSDHKMDPEIRAMIQHDHSQFQTDNHFEEIRGGKNSPFLKQRSNNEAVVLNKYRLALAATGEYTQYWGGTVEQALAAMNVALNRINGVLNRDAALELELVPNNDTLIYLDSSTDPYTGNNSGTLTGENPQVLNQRIGVNNYDIGHVFTRGCSGPAVGTSGGVGIVCGNSKARGASCQLNNNDQFYIDVIAHELGHQFGALHTWNNCPPSNDDPANYNPSAAYEPGSGSTIMSYAGSCQDQNVANRSDDYYHINSIEAILAFTKEGVGLGCATQIVTENIRPEVNIPLDNGFTIPISTPFKLSAEGSDANGDILTYCWEQYDKDFPISGIGEPEGNEPLFRSYSPTSSPTRYFPQLSLLVNNNASNREVLPDYNRDLTFRCTVRDNNEEVGGVSWEEVKFKSTASAGPFMVSNLNDSRQIFEGGQYIEVTWDVANTDQAPVNCHFVNIRLSLDAGFSYPIVLAENTPNDGSAFITIPDTVASLARFMVEAADNIFFDINNFNFEIIPPVDTGLLLNVAPAGVPLHCQPDKLEFEITTEGLNGFSNPIQLALSGDLPENTQVSFSQNPVMPGETSILSMEFTEVDASDINLDIIGIIEGLDTFIRPVFFSTLSNNFDNLNLVAPEDGTSGILLSTPFSWTAIDNANAFDLEIATSPSFGESLVESVSNITDTTYQPSIFFEDNKLHFWRLRPVNDCGPADFLPPSTFHTASISCNKYENDTRVNISGTGLPTVESTITVSDDGIINDLNIPFIKANYQPVNSLQITLVSPAGTEVVLFDKNCGATVNLRMGFDDDAPDEIICPPDDGIVFKPINPLSAFIGEHTKGDWILRVAVVRSGFGASGAIEEWSLEFCSTNAAINPVLVNKDTLFVPPGLSNTFTENELLTTDEDNTASELTYTLVSAPQFGTLYSYGIPLEVGDQFRQRTIDTYDLLFEHNGADNLFDEFSFVVEDGTGGFLPINKVPIKIDESAVVDVNNILTQEAQFHLFPNPTKDLLYIQNKAWIGQRLQIRISNIQGQIIEEYVMDAQELISLTTNKLSKGFYVISVQSEGKIASKRFIKN